MSIKSRKPSREDLLKELEAIRTSLLPERQTQGAEGKNNNVEKNDAFCGFGQQTLNAQPHHCEDLSALDSTLAITQERPAVPDEITGGAEFDYLVNIPDSQHEAPPRAPEKSPYDKKSSNHQDPATMNALPGQQSLFESSEMTGRRKSADSHSGQRGSEPSPGVEDQAENPFLPKHVKDRLQKEKSLYQKEIDAATRLPGLNPYASKPDEHDALVDELVKIYLPKIEQDLRKRLKEHLKDSKTPPGD